MYEQGEKDVYRILLDDGSEVECGLEHLWYVKTREDRLRRKHGRVIKLEEMLKDYRRVARVKKKGKEYYQDQVRYKYSIDIVPAIEYKGRLEEGDISPYLMGVLIGRRPRTGKIVGSENTIRFGEDKSTEEIGEIIGEIKKELPEDLEIRGTERINAYKLLGKKGIYSRSIKRRGKGFWASVERYRLKDSDREGLIPEKYKTLCLEERIELLRGMMDAKGVIYKRERDVGYIYDVRTREEAEEVLELVRGLGAKGIIYKQTNKKLTSRRIINGKCIELNVPEERYSVRFRIVENPFRIKSRREQHKEPGRNFHKKIVKIEKVRREKSRCIYVEEGNHLYVTDGYTLTHNTEIGKRFMSFCVGNNPDKPNMMVSYSAAIAKDKFYNGIMGLVEDENGNYQRIFPKIANVLKSAENMTLDYRDDGRKMPHSEYTMYCCGFDGGITGRTRAHNVLYIDDLIKNMEEAGNKDVMDKKWDEFTATLKKRMQGNCRMLIIGTVFSINDPLSRIIEYYKETAPERLEVVKVPGLNSKGETNFNYKYGYALTTDMLMEDKDLMDPVSFECLIQQNPIERLGILFNEEELRRYDILPTSGFQRNVAAVDVAWGGGDSLSMPIVGEYDNGEVYLIDVVHSKGVKEETIPKVVGKIIEHSISRVHFEANNGGDMYAEKVISELNKQGYKCNITWSKVPTTKSKLDRINGVYSAVMGKEDSTYRLLVKNKRDIGRVGEYKEFMEEVCKFNQTKRMQGRQHDDAPDALASLFTNVLEGKRVGKARTKYSRDQLGI